MITEAVELAGLSAQIAGLVLMLRKESARACIYLSAAIFLWIAAFMLKGHV